MNYFTRRRRQQKTAMIGRSVMQQMQEPPRVKMECGICHQPSEKLNVTASGLFVCDGCKSRIKETSK